MKNRKQYIRMTGAIVVAWFLLHAVESRACTIFVYSSDGKVLVGNNEDAPYSLLQAAKVWVTPGNGESLSRICFGWDIVPGWSPVAQGGMNESGLFLDFAACPRSTTPYDPGKPMFRYNLGEHILANCENVRQALAMVRSHSLPPEHGIFGHFLLADAGGDAAVVEWVEGELRIIEKGERPYLLASNFYLSNPQLGWYPCPRFIYVEKNLKEMKEPSLENFKTILAGVAGYGKDGEGNPAGTLYSNIYDLRNREVTVYYQRDFGKPVRLSLHEELEKGGRTVQLSSLVPDPMPQTGTPAAWQKSK